MKTMIFDNGPLRQADRFTVYIPDRTGWLSFVMSENPLSHKGTNLYAGRVLAFTPPPGVRRVFQRELPREVRTAITKRKYSSTFWRSMRLPRR